MLQTRTFGLLLRRLGLRVGVCVVILIVGQCAELIVPSVVQRLIDNVISKRNWHQFGLFIAIGASATIISAMCAIVVNNVLSFGSHRAMTDLRKELHASVLRFPLAALDSRQPGTYASRIMYDPEGLRYLIGTGAAELIGSIVTAVGAVIALSFVEWHITIVVVAMASVMGLAAWRNVARLRHYFVTQSQVGAELTGRITQTLAGIRTIKAYRAEHIQDIHVTTRLEKLLAEMSGSLFGLATLNGLLRLIKGMIVLVVVNVGIYRVMLLEMSVGRLFMYVMLVELMAGKAQSIAASAFQVSYALAGVDRIDELRGIDRECSLSLESRIRHDRTSADATDVICECVSFGYEPDRFILKNISFDVRPRTKTAIVGKSGCGKTTLVHLLLGFYTPTVGSIRIGGREAVNVRATSVEQPFGLVMQEPAIFDGTVTDNIRLSRADATHDEVRQAARLAQCDEFIRHLNNGYESVLGEKGIKLSTGQQQRIAIARAILAKPRVMILDEATSHVDGSTERLICDGLNGLRDQQCTIVVAHRFSMIEDADQIIVLDHGEIVQRGTHSELIGDDGAYRRLYYRSRGSSADIAVG
jgi:subfamily B ATP-binding cassette protein MsbA